MLIVGTETNRAMQPLTKSNTRVLSYILVTVVLVNNAVYQTAFQFHQPLFVFFLLIFVSPWAIFLAKWPLRTYLVFLAPLVPSLAISVYEVLLNHDTEYLTRALYFFSVFFVFFSCARILSDSAALFPPPTLIVIGYFFAGVIYFIIGDRDLLNPNWFSMTCYYLLALSGRDVSCRQLLLLIGAAMFLYESRGATVVFTLVLILQGSATLRASVRKAAVPLVLATSVFGCFLASGALSGSLSESEAVQSSSSEFISRGLGGRELALGPGWSLFLQNPFFGEGFGASTSFNVEDYAGFEKDVQIHVASLDWGIRAGAFGLIGITWLIGMKLKRADEQRLPFLFGAVVSMLFYNTFALSHVGLNLFAYALLLLSLTRPDSISRTHNG